MKSDHYLNFVWNLGGMLGITLLAVLGFGAVAHLERASEITSSENGAATRDQLIEVANANQSIRQISGLTADVLKHKLSLQLATDLQQLRSRLGTEDYDLQIVGQRFCARILQHERTEPDLYLSSAARMRAEEKRAWAALGDDSFKLLPPPTKIGSGLSNSQPRTDRFGLGTAGQTNVEHFQKDG